MLKRILKPDRNLVLWNGKYYVVNDLTYCLLDMFNKNYSINRIKRETGYRKLKLRRLYKEIEERLLKKDFYEENILLETPIKIQWKITNKCNLHCKHCYLGKLNGQELAYDQIMKIVDSVISSNVMEVTISGGECLTFRGIENVVRELLVNDIKVDIFTNGLLLEKFINSIDKNITGKKDILFYVSIDGMKESHEKIRGKGTFDKTIKNIEYAISKGYLVVTNTVINSINYDDIMEMIMMLKSMGVKDVQLSNIIIQGNATDDLKISLDKQIQLKEKLLELYSAHPELGHIYYSEVPDSEGIRRVFSISSNSEEYIGDDNWKCTAGLARATIDSNGEVYCCPFIKDSYLGNLNNDNLKKVWDNVNRYKFLKRLAVENSDRICLAIKQGRKGKKDD